ncbi:MAG TPA: ribosome biogenesis GTPase Der [Acidobacteriota bacterium]|nr:ribosome biogenesis GTPase Der [Acidobacteriota bacterium]
MYRVAIVGRPNVGKSTLFNRLGRTRKALVGDEPGITRDRIFQIVEWEGKQFEVMDTGGIVPDDKAVLPEKVLEQAELAIYDADLVLLMVDARAGTTPLDQEVAVLLKSGGKEFLVVANKVDVEALDPAAYQFYELGGEKVFPISAEHRLGIADLVDEIVQKVPESESVTIEDEIRIAIIGRPNVGKSSLVNRLLGKERVIVTDIPGTTRDSVDTHFSYQETNYRLVDTAGIRRKGKTELMAEKLSVIMARKNIVQADVVLLLLDATEGATKLDAAIGGYADEAGRPVVVVVNKWDLIEKDTHTQHKLELEFRERMKFLDYAPMIFASAKTGQRVFKLLEIAKEAQSGSRIKIPTGQLNRFLAEDAGPSARGKRQARKPRLKYGCQVGVAPPTIVLFLRGSQKLHFSTVRFLKNRLRERYGFFASPIRIIQRPSATRREKK